MEQFNNLISDKVKKAFKEAGYDERFGEVSLSKRPDLCEYQCNGAMQAAKENKCAPFIISDSVAEILSKDTETFNKVESVKPGFINIVLSEGFISKYLNEMNASDKLGYTGEDIPKNIVVDYGGANVAKPLHVGHLRSAVIGESIKQMNIFAGNNVVGDVHLGDWGLQMGLIIEQLKEDKPELVYFDDSFDGEYPSESPFTLDELESIYPKASARSKEDEEFLKRAQKNTMELQNGNKGYTAIWKHIMELSKKDLKKNYDALNVHFEVWKGESDEQPLIPDMIKDLEDRGLAYESQGALVVDVSEPEDKKEVPPCIVRKSDGAALYATSDLATIIDRRKTYNADEIIYIADKRQELHFKQVFRTARKADYVSADTRLEFLGFGTVNGKDGRPFKTRDGGVMRLEYLVEDITNEVSGRIKESGEITGEEAEETARTVAVAALKYGDLSNQVSRDYIFDIERFASFEGNTGPYILYTVVRIKSILNKAEWNGPNEVKAAITAKEKALELKLTEFNSVIRDAYNTLSPHKICQYMYEIADIFNGFYHDTNILNENDKAIKEGRLSLLSITKEVLCTCLDMLAIKCPERM